MSRIFSQSLLLLILAACLASCESSCEEYRPVPVPAVDTIWIDARVAYPGDSTFVVDDDLSYLNQVIVHDSLLQVTIASGSYPLTIQLENVSHDSIVIEWSKARYSGFDDIDSPLVVRFDTSGNYTSPPIHQPGWLAPHMRSFSVAIPSASGVNAQNQDYAPEMIPWLSDSTQAQKKGEHYVGKVQSFSIPIIAGERERVYRFLLRVVKFRIELTPNCLC
jgi:hypothetical protein